MTKFLFDLKSGKQGEDKVSDILVACGFTVENTGRKTNEWDLVVAGHNRRFTIEVKFDIYQDRSGNIAIEVHNTKKGLPSGLYATKSDLWCQVLKNSIWLTSTGLLRTFVDSVIPDRLIECGGDKNATLFLYREQVVLPAIFFRIDNLTTKEIVDICKNLTTKNQNIKSSAPSMEKALP